MKKIGVILAIVVALIFVVGCPSTGGSSASGGGGAKSAGALQPYSVDLSTLPYVKNKTPFTRNYDDLIIRLPDFPVDVTKYTRVTITCKYFDETGAEIEQSDTKAMVSLVYDPTSKDRGPDMGPGGNAPLKEFNVGGYSGMVNTDRGVRVMLSKAPGAIILQNSNISVKYIELTGITFHTGSASGTK